MHKPLVSVVIPVFNRRRLLVEALESVLRQTEKSFEVIIVDDGSTEGSLGVLEDIIVPVPPETRIEILSLEHSGRPGFVRNRGAGTARGEYLAFLDSDDLWLPEKLSLQLSLMRQRSGIALSHTREIWSRGGKIMSQSKQRFRRDGMVFEDALLKCTIGPSTVMIERSLFLEAGGFREDIEIAEDYELWLRLTAFREVAYLDVPLTVKRAGHGDQLSEKYGQIERFRIEALSRLVEERFFPPEKEKAARTVLAEKCRIYAAGCLKRGRSAEASRYLEMAAACGPGL